MKKISIPGSKSVSNRALVLAAISPRPVLLQNLLVSDDIQYLRESLAHLGVRFEDRPDGLLVTPPGKLTAPQGTENYIGAGGTPARFISAVSLITFGSYKVHGIDRIHERPFADLFSALKFAGVEITYEGNEGFLPAVFTNDPSVHTERPVITISGKISSQFVSGLMLVAPRLRQGMTLVIDGNIPSKPYVEMTAKTIELFGGKCEIVGDWERIEIEYGLDNPEVFMIPGDASSLSYPVTWSVLMGTSVSVENVGLDTMHGDEKFLDYVRDMGGRIRREEEKCFIEGGTELKSLGMVDFEKMPDVSMTGMVVAAVADGMTEFHGLESLRVKECDRIHAMVEGLTTLGIKTEVEGDVVRVFGRPDLIRKPQATYHKLERQIDSYDDHRIAFCFGLLLNAITDLNVREIHDRIIDAHSVSKSWPDFWSDLAEWNDQLRLVSGVIVKKSTSSHEEEIHPQPLLSQGGEKSPLIKGDLGGLYLIVKKPRKDHAWQFPQGGVDSGESGWQAAKRELIEECGSDLCVKFKGEQAVGNYRYLFPADFTRHNAKYVGADVSFYLAEYIDGDVMVDGSEIIDYKWVTEEELGEYFDTEYLEKILTFLS